MAKNIKIVGAKPKKIEVLDKPKRRIEPEDLAAALGANPSGHPVSGNLDLIALAELGTQLLHRLRSSGGRPALADATVNCRVPLSPDDIKTLEGMVAQIGGSTGAKPSVGQLVSVIVHSYLVEFACGMNTGTDSSPACTEVELLLPAWGNLFPNIADLRKVAARARIVAQRGMPLMMMADVA
jgi:hypothetical protein